MPIQLTPCTISCTISCKKTLYNFKWTTEVQQAFRQLKEKLMTATVLCTPVFNLMLRHLFCKLMLHPLPGSCMIQPPLSCHNLCYPPHFQHDVSAPYYYHINNQQREYKIFIVPRVSCIENRFILLQQQIEFMMIRAASGMFDNTPVKTNMRHPRSTNETGTGTFDNH